ncbi:hypothetical protein GCM10009841_06710 [Microlunatus panaciterrae]|uniref:Uncharacterized protein n=1 Tax=Microlunatus panaciterrae TaxID=400768 RepID=A0ABS2RI57_9ACTN|nr:hypothetical protein [Microlunatus panaciterrae]MBM7798675.1 hypothetical protein [Microlunatus panaciterrae]
MKKVALVVLVVIMVIVVGTLVAGRVGGNRGSSQDRGLAGFVDSFAPHTDVKPADVAGASCFNAALGGFAVEQSSVCQVRMPSKANRITLCLVQGQLSALTIKGRDYPAQQLGKKPMGCDDPLKFSLYDTGSVLVIGCLPFSAPCQIRVV